MTQDLVGEAVDAREAALEVELLVARDDDRGDRDRWRARSRSRRRHAARSAEPDAAAADRSPRQVAA